jgi:hypothetical protein
MRNHARHPDLQGHIPRRRAHGSCTAGMALAAALVAWALTPRPAAAAEGLYLTWNDCYLGASQTSNRVFACLDDTGDNQLFCAFTMPQAADKVVAVEIVVDIQHSSSPLPDWWRLDVGGCRQGSISADYFPGPTSCLDMWQGMPSAISGVQGYLPTQPRGLSSQARIKVAASVLRTESVSLDGSSMYHAARIVINNARTVGPPLCNGCGLPACLVLNSILIGRDPSAPGGDVFLQIPGANDANWAQWQGGVGANCTAVPVRNRTWGQVKSLYR